jgi:hypothetical protein
MEIWIFGIWCDLGRCFFSKGCEERDDGIYGESQDRFDPGPQGMFLQRPKSSGNDFAMSNPGDWLKLTTLKPQAASQAACPKCGQPSLECSGSIVEEWIGGPFFWTLHVSDVFSFPFIGGQQWINEINGSWLLRTWATVGCVV